MLDPSQRVHIVGIGGFGMSAIARVLLGRGFAVSGSDLRANDLTAALAESGATIYQGHDPAHIGGADVVVRTSAATDDNPEVAAALAAGIPVLRRRDMLGELMADRQGIAIAGTHGKTTTTALLAHVLIASFQDPTYIVGGVMANTGTNAGVGKGPHFVIEADEYDHMFLGLRPRVAVVTGIEHDHVDCFPTEDDMLRAFRDFVALLPDDGLLVACSDDPHARALAADRHAAGRPVVCYGLGPSGIRRSELGQEEAAARVAPLAWDWIASEIRPEANGGTSFSVTYAEKYQGRIFVPLAGEHNVLNTLAVVAVANRLGIPMPFIRLALETFEGTGRRGEVLGQAGGVTVISDYGHHPTEIRATLAAFRQRPGVRDLWAVWQPHTYTRLRALADDFAGAFGAADHVLVTDVYSVREQVAPGLDAAAIADRIAQNAAQAAPNAAQAAPNAAQAAQNAAARPDVRYTGALHATAQALAAQVLPGDLVVILSAGDAPQLGEQLLASLRQDAPDQEEKP